ncbi:MAG: hypothetical protein JO048_01255 [Methylobacteriaceae bacterium]|nr:hypothetical protein [Methylobacteriaceae bacterium]
MRIGHARDVEWAGVSRHRDATITFKRLITGEPGPENFELALVRMDGPYTTPRHRHNYDQIRLALDGALNFAPGRDLAPGAVGYFPEGTYYGPQAVAAGSLSMAVQFGGASGQGLLSYDDLGRGSRELAAKGRFENGVYTETGPDGQRRNKDGFEAVWEHVTGRPLVYAPTRFTDPVVMHPDSFVWRRSADGLAIKHLGTFGERRVALELIRLAPGARHARPLEDRSLAFVLAGGPTIGGEPLALHDAAAFEPGERAEIAVEDASATLMLITLPSLPAVAAVAAAA